MNVNRSLLLITGISFFFLSLLLLISCSTEIEPSASTIGDNLFLTPQPTVCITTTPRSQGYPPEQTFEMCHPNLSFPQSYPIPGELAPTQSARHAPQDLAQILVPQGDLDIVGNPQIYVVHGDDLYWIATLASDEIDILKTDLNTNETIRLNIPTDKLGFHYLHASGGYLMWQKRSSREGTIFVYNLNTQIFDFEKQLTIGISQAQLDMRNNLVVWQDRVTSNIYTYDLVDSIETLFIEEAQLIWPTACSRTWVVHLENYDWQNRKADLVLHNPQTDEKIVIGILETLPVPAGSTPTFACDAEHVVWRQDGQVQLFDIETRATTAITTFNEYSPNNSFYLDQDILLVGAQGSIGYDLSTDTIFDPYTEPRSTGGQTRMSNRYYAWSWTTEALVDNFYIVPLIR